MAYSYLGKSDFANAKTNVDEFFAREKEGFVATDYQLKADIYTGGGATCEEYMHYTCKEQPRILFLQSKIDFMTKAADYFKTKNCKLQEADMRMAWFNARGNANPTYLVNFGILYFQAEAYLKADSVFAKYISLMPDSIYGYDWRGRANFTIDTTMTVEPYATQFVTNYQKTLDIAFTDKLRYKTQGLRAALLLAGYYNNIRAAEILPMLMY